MIRTPLGVHVLLALAALTALAICIPDGIQRSLALYQPPEMVVPQTINLSAVEIETQVLDLVNAQRQQAGLCPLKASSTLVGIARTRSQDMAARGALSHHDPETYELAAFKLLAQEGLHGGGENLYLAQGLTEGVPQAVVTWWMGSRTHRANLLGSDYGYTGVGVALGPDREVYVTQILLQAQ